MLTALLSVVPGEAARLQAAFLAGGVLLLVGGGCASSRTPPEGSAPPKGSAPPASQGQIVSGRPLSDAHSNYARRHFIRGLTSARLNDYGEAIREYEQALEAAPEEAALLSAMAEAQAAREDLSAALYYADLARRARPGKAHYHRQVANLYDRSGQTEQAIQAYERLLEHTPDDADARLALARLQKKTGRFEDALVTYRALIEQIGPSTTLRLEMLGVHHRLGDTAGVERTLKALVRDDPEENRFRRALGSFYRRQGRPEDAARLLRSALEHDPTDAEAAALLEEIYRATDRADRADAVRQRTLGDEGTTAAGLVRRALPLYRRAKQGDAEAADTAAPLLRKALDKDPANADALEMLGTLRFRAGHYEAAAALLTRSLEQNPRAPKRWLRAAAAHLRAGQPRRATEVADEGLLLFPGRLPLLRVSSSALMASNRNDDAIARLEEALRVMKDDDLLDKEKYAAQAAAFHAALGLLYSRKQKHETSDRHYGRALDYDADNLLALNNFAYSLAERGVRLEHALSLARRAVKQEPKNPSFLDTLGWVLFKLERYDAARAQIRTALETGEASPTVYKHYGDIAEAQGRASEARSYWQKAIDHGLKSSALREKLGAAASN